MIFYTWAFFAFFVAFVALHSALLLLSAAELRRYAARASSSASRLMLRSPLAPPITVIVPAYNEEAVILDTVRSVLASNYPRLEVLVIDDGSTDHTAELVRENFSRDPRVRLLLQPNRGKPTALNHALAEETGEIVVSIDADTIVDPMRLRFSPATSPIERSAPSPAT